MKRFIIMHEGDDVAIALEDAAPGDTAQVRDAQNNAEVCRLTVHERIPYGHKIALRSLPAGCHLKKYGAIIGECTQAIAEGCLVHVHNVKSLSADIPEAFKHEILRQMGLEGYVS